jgi:3alpha(or 20beta)-hydroxysteroid dehydrogenase
MSDTPGSGRKVVIISGTTGGLGKALTEVFASADYSVIGLYHSDINGAQALERDFLKKQYCGTFLQCDISQDESWVEVEKTLRDGRETARITLINNACAFFTPRPLHLLNWPDFEQQLNVALKGAFLGLRHLLALMVRAGSGTVINVGSSALQSAPKGFAAYLAGKAALDALSRVAANEYGARGIRVLSLHPGFMDTPLTARWSPHLRQLIAGQSGALLSTGDVAQSVLWAAEGPRIYDASTRSSSISS